MLLELFYVEHLFLKLFLNLSNTNEKLQVLSNYEWNSFEYTFKLRESLRNVSGNNWFAFILNSNFCLFK